MVRVSLKNTFLSFDENDDEEGGGEVFAPTRKSPSPRQAASPRSRSVECPSPTRDLEDRPEGVQIEKLNKLLGTELLPTPIRSPLQSSPARSASPVPSVEALPSARLQEDRTAGSQYSLGPMNSGPSAQELKQLQRRLEEVCHPRHRHSSVTSIGSVSSVEEFDGARDAEGRPFQMSGSLHQVWSSASVSTLASGEPLDEEPQEYGAAVEFDLTIEEVPGDNSSFSNPQAPFDLRVPGPQQLALHQSLPFGAPQPPRNHSHSPTPLAAGPLQQASGSMQPQLGPQQQLLLQQQVPRSSHRQIAHRERQRTSSGQLASPRSSPSSSRGTAPAAVVEAQPVGPMVPAQPGDATLNMVPWHRRPWPKEYRHGHVPKNLNLEEEYKHGRDAAPTTLMIRNIPNHYTQRQLINELDDLGFKGTFDFLYIPLDKGTMSNVGYAFVNFVEPEWAERCMTAFQNYRFKRHRKIAAVSVAHIQGLEANLAHYENAAVNTAKLKQRRPVIMANISQTLSSALAGLDSSPSHSD